MYANRLKNPNKKDILLCGLLVAAFCYELPLIEITQYDRFNPRLVDVMTVIALFFTRWKRNKTNKLLRIWEFITVVFVLAAIISYVFLLPKQYGYYSIFFALKYIETLLGLWILTGFNWQNHHIEKLLKFFCYGIIFAGCWGLLQFAGILPTDRYLPTGELIVKQENTILATFGTTYFHSGFMGAMGTGIALALSQRKALPFWLFGLAFSASLFLATFSGSRAALAAAVIIIITMVSKNRKTLVATVSISLILFSLGAVKYIQENSITAQRINESASHNTVEKRLTANYFSLFGRIISFHGPKLFITGGGFYAVPLPDERGNGIRYRVGYGFHNIYFFPLEQAGIAALLGSLYLFYFTLKHAAKRRDSTLARCGLGIILAITILGWTGQIFFHGFGTENMITFQMFLLIVLITMSKRDNKDA